MFIAAMFATVKKNEIYPNQLIREWMDCGSFFKWNTRYEYEVGCISEAQGEQKNKSQKTKLHVIPHT